MRCRNQVWWDCEVMRFSDNVREEQEKFFVFLHNVNITKPTFQKFLNSSNI